MKLLQEEVPPNVYYAHYKNVEKAAQSGKFDPTAGLSSSGIAGTAPEKEEEENKGANADEEMKDISKKDGGKLKIIFSNFGRTDAHKQNTFLMYDFHSTLIHCSALHFVY